MTLRSLRRHKIRSFLTAFGVTLAIAAIVSLGSISEGINSMVQEQMSMASDFIAVAEKGVMGGGLNPQQGMASKVDTDIIDGILEIDGVEEVGRRNVMMDPSTNVFIVGIDLSLLDMFDLDNMDFAEGGWPEEGMQEIAAGYQMAEMRGLGVGDELKLNDDEYVITGVLEEMKNFMDYASITSYQAFAETYNIEGYAMTLVISPSDVRESERIAREIEDRFDTVEAFTSAEALEAAEDTIDQLRVMTLAIGIVASIVASIGIINTMMMAVFERRREFGIMKALGAKREVIMSFVLQEGAILAIIGGSVGLTIGFAGTEAMNQMMGMPLAAVTPELAILSMIYGIAIAVLASAYPAYQAINVDPVEAMRQE